MDMINKKDYVVVSRTEFRRTTNDDDQKYAGLKQIDFYVPTDQAIAIQEHNSRISLEFIAEWIIGFERPPDKKKHYFPYYLTPWEGDESFSPIREWCEENLEPNDYIIDYGEIIKSRHSPWLGKFFFVLIEDDISATAFKLRWL